MAPVSLELRSGPSLSFHRGPLGLSQKVAAYKQFCTIMSFEGFLILPNKVNRYPEEHGSKQVVFETGLCISMFVAGRVSPDASIGSWTVDHRKSPAPKHGFLKLCRLLKRQPHLLVPWDQRIGLAQNESLRNGKKGEDLGSFLWLGPTNLHLRF